MECRIGSAAEPAEGGLALPGGGVRLDRVRFAEGQFRNLDSRLVVACAESQADVGLGQIPGVGDDEVYQPPEGKAAKRAVIRNDGGAPLAYGEHGMPIAVRTPEDVIMGEMTCMSHYPRSATVIAMDDAEVLEIRRNVLYVLQRNPLARELLNKVYRERALTSHLQQISLLSDFDDAERRACAEFLRDKVDLIRVDPGQIVFRQGQPADHFYMVRLGFVKVSQSFKRGRSRPGLSGTGTILRRDRFTVPPFGLIAAKGGREFSGLRTATCTALDDVELVRIQGKHFRQLVEGFPKLRERLIAESISLLDRDASARKTFNESLEKFLDDGLFAAQNLLVLDLESCTRCDECTKACADTHGGVTRLIREGLRFDKFLVASSCRSCLDPYCLVGCPVDAIHRVQSKEIQIEDHCIGCGLCAQNCPYGNINMHELLQQRDDPEQCRSEENRQHSERRPLATCAATSWGRIRIRVACMLARTTPRSA